MTPYQYAGNNPINIIDINGDSLDVHPLDMQAREDLRSMLPKDKKYDNVLGFNNYTGSVSMDLSSLSNTDIENGGAGLELLNSMINGELKDKKFFYGGSTAMVHSLNADGNKIVHYAHSFPDVTLPKAGMYYPGYDGAAFVYKGVETYSWNGSSFNKNSRAGDVFHAIAESVFLASNGGNYVPAHTQANLAARDFYKRIGTGNISMFKVYHNGKLWKHEGADIKNGGRLKTFVRNGIKL